MPPSVKRSCLSKLRSVGKSVPTKKENCRTKVSVSGEKTEQPTPKRLRDSREKGDIAKSTEIVSFAVVAVIIFYFIINAKGIFSELLSVTSTVFNKAPVLPFSEALSFRCV